MQETGDVAGRPCRPIAVSIDYRANEPAGAAEGAGGAGVMASRPPAAPRDTEATVMGFNPGRMGCWAICWMLLAAPGVRGQTSAGGESSEQASDQQDESGAAADESDESAESSDESSDSTAESSDASAGPSASAADDEDAPRTHRAPSVAAILRAFQEAERPVLRPVGADGRTGGGRLDPFGSPVEGSARQAPRYPDGHYLVERTGWLDREGPWYTFVFESEAKEDPQPPMKLLPNRMLEWMVREAEGSSEQVAFRVSGEVTDCFGENFLLLRKSLRKRSMGNLTR